MYIYIYIHVRVYICMYLCVHMAALIFWENRHLGTSMGTFTPKLHLTSYWDRVAGANVVMLGSPWHLELQSSIFNLWMIYG